MRILYLHQYFNTPAMAGGTRSYELARRLVRAGHEVHMITSWREPHSSRDWFVTKEDGIIVHWLPISYSNSMGFLARIKAFLRFALASSRKVASMDGDLVYATSTPLTIVIPGAYGSWRRRIPMVFEVRDMWPDVPIALGFLRNRLLVFLARRLEAFAYGYARRIVALAPGMRADIISKGIAAEKVSVIPNGCDVGLYREWDGELADLQGGGSWVRGARILIYAGALGRANGVEYLVFLAEELLKNGSQIKIVVIGDGSEKNTILNLAISKNILDENFYLIDSMPKAALVGWSNAATMHVALMQGPYKYTKDAVNNKFFDALACGKPIANNFDGWQADLAEEADVGVRLDPTDYSLAAKVLTKAFDNTEWLNGVEERALRMASGRFSRDSLAADLEHLLCEVKKG